MENLYLSPEHRLAFYEAMLKRALHLKEEMAVEQLGLCAIVYNVSMFVSPFKEEDDIPSIENNLPELYAQMPPMRLHDGAFWWNRYNIDKRINAIEAAIKMLNI